jgi:hypothetical protein
MSDDTETEGTSPEAEGTPEASLEPKVTTPPDEVVLARKRQSGAEEARRIAESRAKELEAELSKYRTAAQTEAEKDLTELAKAQARAEAAEKTAQEAEKAAMAKVLDRLYPNARKELPEVTDEVRLAKFEALLAEDEETPPTPLRHNESRSGSPKGSAAKEESAADIRARLESTPLPW